MSGWPDPERPGVPRNPSRSGPHWVGEKVHIWIGHTWTTIALKEAAQLPYGGPVTPPTEVAALRAENARLREALSELVDAIDALTGDSAGVYGLHLNGDPSPWSHLLSGGRYEEWLGVSLDAARTALAHPADGVAG